MPSSNLVRLLLRNPGCFRGRRLILAGELADPALPGLCKEAAAAWLLCDFYPAFCTMAAALGQRPGTACQSLVESRNLRVLFAPLEYACTRLESADTLLLLLPKNKQQAARLLHALQQFLHPGDPVYIAGANSGGGRSAGSLLAPAGTAFKIDSASKCTLFRAEYRGTFPAPAASGEVTFRQDEVSLRLKGDPALFNGGKVDEGTALLLSALGEVRNCSSVLDLCCGSGAAGMYLAAHGCTPDCCDSSAQALAVAQENARLNQLDGRLHFFASDMLGNCADYEVIAVNPPFHQGVQRSLSPAAAMIAELPAHLKPQGRVYLVGNNCLHYDALLKARFRRVETVRSNRRFSVYKASEPESS